MGPIERYEAQRPLARVGASHHRAARRHARHGLLCVLAAHRARGGGGGRFGEGFSLARMSWIKPNFLWMMHRAGWATKPAQESVLAVSIAREGFDALLAAAVHAAHVPEVYGDRGAWQRAVKASDVRLQWDPDHAPGGPPVLRRALQLGLRDGALRRYVDEWILGIEDITDFVRAQHRLVLRGDLDALETPREEVYSVGDPAVAARLQLDPWPPPTPP
ncbi:MAG: DUF4291 family protein [Polyangiales bacterium]